MANLILQSIQTLQPQQNAKVDFSNPLTSSLALITNAGAGAVFDSISSRFATPNSIGLKGSIKGVGYTSTAGKGALWPVPTNVVTSNGAFTGDFTYFMYGNPQPSGSVELMLGQTNGGPTFTECYFVANGSVALAATNGMLAFSVTGVTGVQFAGGVDGKYHFYVYTKSGTTGTLYIDGIAVATATVTNSPIGTAGTSNDFVGGYINTSFGTTAAVAIAGAHNRALSATEVSALSNNPFALYKSPQRNLWATIISSATNVNGTLGQENLTGQSANVFFTTEVAGTTGQLNLTGQPASAQITTEVAGTTASESLNGQSANINAVTNVSTNLGLLNEIGQSASVSISSEVIVTIAAIENLTGQSASISNPLNIPMSVAILNETGNQATLSVPTNVVTQQAQLNEVGALANVAPSGTIQAMLATINLTGLKAGILTSVFANTAQLNITPYPATVLITPGLYVNAQNANSIEQGHIANIVLNNDIAAANAISIIQGLTMGVSFGNQTLATTAFMQLQSSMGAKVFVNVQPVLANFEHTYFGMADTVIDNTI